MSWSWVHRTRSSNEGKTEARRKIPFTYSSCWPRTLLLKSICCGKSNEKSYRFHCTNAFIIVTYRKLWTTDLYGNDTHKWRIVQFNSNLMWNLGDGEVRNILRTPSVLIFIYLFYLKGREERQREKREPPSASSLPTSLQSLGPRQPNSGAENTAQVFMCAAGI